MDVFQVVIIAVAVLAIIALICGVMLTVASKFMAVEEDELFPAVRECLPGANCGACGFAGCDGYASALVADPELSITLCVPGGASAAQQLGQVLGREGGEVVKMVAEVRCGGTCAATSAKMDYEGIESCAAAKLLFGGSGACIYGCAGLGDCVKVCPEKAIYLVGGIARVDTGLCTGCGLCAKTCPNGVIAVRPASAPVVVDCNNTRPGAETRKACTVGCIGCKLCERNCPAGAITVTNNLASVSYEKCVGCGKCVEVCPSKCIVGLNLVAGAKQA